MTTRGLKKMADMAEIEELQLTLEGEICGLDMEGLTVLAVELDVAVEGHRRLRVCKKIREKIEADLEQCETAAARKQLLENLSKIISSSPPQLGNEDSIDLPAEPIKIPVVKSVEKEASKFTSVDISKVLKRELKIRGQIVGGESKDGLSFVSLIRQLENAAKAGYTESEITEAVIRAVSPNLKLRSYLEMCPNLTLAKLRQILRAHYKQKSGTELYQELSVLCQAPKESAQDFLIRAMNLRQQVIFASNASDCGIKYEPALVQSLFTHVVETGLQQESVRAKLRPLLEKKGITDEELMEQLNKAVSAESERNNKMGIGKHKVVNQVSVDISSCNGSNNENRSASKEPKQNKLMAALEAVQADVTSLRDALHKTQVNQVQSQTPAKSVFRHKNQNQRKLCQACQEADERQCSHCFKCGSAEHFARGCKKNLGNSRGLHSRDRM